MPQFSLSALDVVLILVYLIGTIRYDLKYAKRSCPEAYFLPGRYTGWDIFGISLVAANIASAMMDRFAKSADSTRISVFSYGWRLPGY